MANSRALPGLLLTGAFALLPALPAQLAAQDPRPTPVGTVIAPGLTLAQTVATREERPMVERIIQRLKAKAAADKSLMERVEKAVLDKKPDVARNLLATALELPATEVSVGINSKRRVGSDDQLENEAPSFFQPVAYHPAMTRSRFNPYLIAFKYKTISVCFGSDAACKSWLYANS